VRLLVNGAADHFVAEQTTLIVQFAQDLLASAVPLSASKPVRPKPDSHISDPSLFSPASGAKSLDEEDSIKELDSSLAKLRVGSRFDRGASEPPPDTGISASVPVSHSETPLGRSPPAEYTWDWGGMPKKSKTLPPIAVQRALDMEQPGTAALGLESSVPRRKYTEKDRPLHQHRGATFPRIEKAGGADESLGKPGKLKNDEDDPYLFILEMEGVSHKFELSLCGVDGFASQGEGNVSEIAVMTSF
jgi:hypothetical protein